MKKTSEYVVNRNSGLLEYLINDLGLKRSEAKGLLEHNGIIVNGINTTKYNYGLKRNDKLVLNYQGNYDNSDLPFDIIYQDDDFIVIDKPYGLLSIATEKEKEKTCYHYLRQYLNNKGEKLFVLHRLDKNTSGVLVFVKSEKMQKTLQEKWNDIVLTRKYFGVVKGKIKEDGHLVNYLYESENGKVYIGDNKNGKKAITDYKVVKSNDDYSLLDIDIKTGRKNQIRVTFSSLNHPIVGDEKYGEKKSLISRTALHAYQLSFINPQNNKTYLFKSKMPNNFKKFFVR